MRSSAETQMHPPRRSFIRFPALLRLTIFLGLAVSVQAQGSRVRLDHIKLHEVDTLFQNPGQGFFFEPFRGEPRFPDSVVYLRFDWQRVEPEEGKFNWRFIDRAIEKARQHSATIAMRVMTADAHSGDQYASPKWLFDEGCKSFPYTNDGKDAAQGGTMMERLEPDYSDPIYLTKQEEFLRAFGERYDGNPNIEFLDIGSYGIWGEWHTTHPASIAVRQQIVDMYLKAFPQTRLIYMSDDAELMNYALAHGAGLRRDGVGSPWHEERWTGTPAYANVPTMGDAWKHAPIIFEWFQQYDYLVSHHWSFDSAVNFMLRNHVTMINDNLGTVPQKVMPKLQMLARRSGYRFVLRDFTQPREPRAGTSVQIAMHWENVGVGKLYRPYKLSVALRNAADELVVTGSSDADPSSWLPGKNVAIASLLLPSNLAAGVYAVEVGLFDVAGQRQPLRLAIDSPEKDGWYLVSHIKVK